VLLIYFLQYLNEKLDAAYNIEKLQSEDQERSQGATEGSKPPIHKSKAHTKI